jgi:L,D-transpeptidase YcbB
MIAVKGPTAFVVFLVTLFFLGFGCHSQIAPTPPQPGSSVNAEAVAGDLRAIASKGTLAELTFPNFPDYSQQVQAFYQAVNYSPVWVRLGGAIPQALAMITAFQGSRQKGLNPEDYDASRWPQRLAKLQKSPFDANTVAEFDAALTVSAMRYISDLHIGRVNPKRFKVGFDVEQKKYDLPQFLAQKILPASNGHDKTLNAVLAKGPPYL